MNWEELQQYLLGGGGIIALLSLWGTFRGSDKKSRMDLVDRLYKEIERMDEKETNNRERIMELETSNSLKDELLIKQEAEMKGLRETIEELSEKVNKLQEYIDEQKGG